MPLEKRHRKKLERAANGLMGVLGWFHTGVQNALRRSREADNAEEERDELRLARKEQELADKTQTAIRRINEVLEDTE